MPNIEQINLTPGQVDIRPSELGVEAAVQAGRRIGSFTHQLGEAISRSTNIVGNAVVKHNEDLEKQQMLSAFTKADMQDDEDRRSFLNLPENQGNPYASMEYYEKYSKPRYDDLLGQAKTDAGKALAQQLWDRSVRTSFDHSATVASAVAGQQHITAIDERKNYWNARITADPSSVDDARKGFAAEVAATRPSMADPARAAEEEGVYLRAANKDFAHTYYATMLNRLEDGVAAGQDVTALKKQFDDDIAQKKFSEDIGTEFPDLQRQEQTRIQQGEERYHTSQTMGQKAAADQVKGILAQVDTALSDMVADPSKFNQTTFDALIKKRDQIVSDPKLAGLVPGELEHTNDLIRTLSKARADGGYVQSDPKVVSDLIGRLTIPKGAPGYITDAELVKDALDPQHPTLSRQAYTDIREARERANNDPSMKQAMEQFNQWRSISRQALLKEALGQPTFDTYQILNAFDHDSSVFFMGSIKAQGDPMKAVEAVTGSGPNRFSLDFYRHAIQRNGTLADMVSRPDYKAFAASQGMALGSDANPLPQGHVPLQKTAPQPEAAAPGVALSSDRRAAMDAITGGR